MGPGRRETEIGKDQRGRGIDSDQQTKKRRGYFRKKKEAKVKQRLLAAWRTTIKSGQDSSDDSSSSDKCKREKMRREKKGRKGRWRWNEGWRKSRARRVPGVGAATATRYAVPRQE